MWMLSNRTPYAAERNWFVDKNAAKAWVVAVKGTFDILADGSTRLAQTQEKLLYGEEYYGEPGRSSLRYDGDLGGPKRSTDVILNGHAYAPGARALTEVVVTLSVQRISKRLRVVGNRRWKKGVLGLSMTPPEPFTKMALTYERAFGGSDTRSENRQEHRLEPRNPIGTGFAIRSEHLVDQPLPNIEYPDELISSWKERPRPAGFGIVASYWSPRLQYAGSYDKKWQQERFPLAPEDFDDRFMQCAPPDQQTDSLLHGGEAVELINLSPSGRLSFRLPKVRLGFETRFGQERVPHPGRLHTVILEPDVPRVMLVWHSTLECATSRVDYLDETRIIEKEYR
jgi:hypothetical protein